MIDNENKENSAYWKSCKNKKPKESSKAMIQSVNECKNEFHNELEEFGSEQIKEEESEAKQEYIRKTRRDLKKISKSK